MSAGPARLYSREAPADGARQPGTLREPAAGSSISALPTRPGRGGTHGRFWGSPPRLSQRELGPQLFAFSLADTALLPALNFPA